MPADDGALQVRVREERDGRDLALLLSGDVCLLTAAILRRAVAAAQELRPDRLVLDLGGVGVFGAAGVAELTRAVKAARSRRTTVVVRSASRLHQRVLEMTGHGDLLDGERVHVLETVDGIAERWVSTCRCGWRSSAHRSSLLASGAFDGHAAASGHRPLEARLRDQRAHALLRGIELAEVRAATQNRRLQLALQRRALERAIADPSDRRASARPAVVVLAGDAATRRRLADGVRDDPRFDPAGAAGSVAELIEVALTTSVDVLLVAGDDEVLDDLDVVRMASPETVVFVVRDSLSLVTILDGAVRRG